MKWELLPGPPPEPTEEELAYDKRRASNARNRCLACGRFLPKGTVRMSYGMVFNRVVWDCPKCGEQSEPLG